MNDRLPRPVAEMLMGAAAPLHGLVILARTRALWPYAAAPMLLGLGWSALTLLDVMAAPSGDAAWYWRALGFVLHAVLATGILLIQILIAAAAPVLDWLGEQTEEALGHLPKGPPFWQELTSVRFWKRAGLALVEAVKLLGFKLVLAVAALAVGWIPQIGPAAAYALTGIATSADFIDYPLARRDMSLRAKLDWMKLHWPAATVFGGVVLLFLTIPGAGGLILAPAVIGGTDLVFKLGDVPPHPHAPQA